MQAIKLNSSFKDELKIIHGRSKGWITYAEKSPNFRQYHYKVEQLLEEGQELINPIDSYISQNTFYKPQRSLETVKELNCLYIDIDCTTKGYIKEAALFFLETELFGKEIPNPSLVVDSGRGIWLKWKIETAPYQAVPLWAAIQRYLYRKLEEFGADPACLDPTRISRVIGTVNSKSDSTVKILRNNDLVYTLREIQEEYLPELPINWREKRKYNVEKKRGNPGKVVQMYNAYRLNYDRLNDLVHLIELRSGNMKDMREIAIFLYRYWNLCYYADHAEALTQALELNERLDPPLTEREVIKSTKSAEKGYEAWKTGDYIMWNNKPKRKGYNYTNDRLIEMLKITDQEQRELKTIISKGEKYRRNNERRKQIRRNEKGKTARESEKELKMAQVKELKEKGFKQREIAEMLELSLRMVKYYYAEIKKVQ